MSFSAKTIVADFRTSLSSRVLPGETVASIQNNLDDDGVPLPTGSYYFTIDADSATKEHIACELNGKSLTNIRSVSRQGVETTGFAREHRTGASVTITDFAHIKMISDFASQFSGAWENPVENYAALVALSNPKNGEARVTLDDGSIYIYNESTSTWIKQTPGTTSLYRTDLLGTQSVDDDHKTFQLASGSFSDDDHLLVYLNGVLQKVGEDNDYQTANNNQAIFNYELSDDDLITLIVIA